MVDMLVIVMARGLTSNEGLFCYLHGSDLPEKQIDGMRIEFISILLCPVCSALLRTLLVIEASMLVLPYL